LIFLLKEYYYGYILSPFLIVAIIILLISYYLMLQFAVIFLILKFTKQESISGKKVKIITSTLFVILVVCFVAGHKLYRYYKCDKFLVEGENNLVYTFAYLDSVKREKASRHNIIREYRGEFTFFVDGKPYGDIHILPKDYTNYIYFIKMNMDNIKYSSILPVPIKHLPKDIKKMEIPVSGWYTNPIPSIIVKYKN